MSAEPATKKGHPDCILTLDAGGTSMVFRIVKEGRLCLEPVILKSNPVDLGVCLKTLVSGFSSLLDMLTSAGFRACGISFAFPGPADYSKGIIVNPPNFPAFRNPFPLGPWLEEQFGLPVFIQNDGNLFTLGEALEGFLPWVNAVFHKNGVCIKYNNLLGITLGTGLGCGFTCYGKLLHGDSGNAAEIWNIPDNVDAQQTVESVTGVFGIRSMYADLTGGQIDDVPDPQGIAAIAQGRSSGDKLAAREVFNIMGRSLGHAAAIALNMTDSLLVLGGGVSGAYDLFKKAFFMELESSLHHCKSGSVARLSVPLCDLEDEAGRNSFFNRENKMIQIPGADKGVRWDGPGCLGVGLSRLGTSNAVAAGAWHYARSRLFIADCS